MPDPYETHHRRGHRLSLAPLLVNSLHEQRRLGSRSEHHRSVVDGQGRVLILPGRMSGGDPPERR